MDSLVPRLCAWVEKKEPGTHCVGIFFAYLSIPAICCSTWPMQSFPLKFTDCHERSNADHYHHILFVHCKNTWVTLTTFVGCPSECYQIGFLGSLLRNFFFSSISSALSSEDLFGYIPGILVPKLCNQGTLPRQCVTSQNQQTSPEMLIYMLSERRY